MKIKAKKLEFTAMSSGGFGLGVLKAVDENGHEVCFDYDEEDEMHYKEVTPIEVLIPEGTEIEIIQSKHD